MHNLSNEAAILLEFKIHTVYLKQFDMIIYLVHILKKGYKHDAILFFL